MEISKLVSSKHIRRMEKQRDVQVLKCFIERPEIRIIEIATTNVRVGHHAAEMLLSDRPLGFLDSLVYVLKRNRGHRGEARGVTSDQVCVFIIYNLTERKPEICIRPKHIGPRRLPHYMHVNAGRLHTKEMLIYIAERMQIGVRYAMHHQRKCTIKACRNFHTERLPASANFLEKRLREEMGMTVDAHAIFVVLTFHTDMPAACQP